MATITITLIDQPRGAVSVRTDSDKPVIGRTCTPAQALAMDLLRTCGKQASEVQYGPETVPLVAFANAVRAPDDLGHAVSPEVRRRATEALGATTDEARA